MLTYEYLCPQCGLIEISHSITEPARSECPLCARPVRRQVSGGAGFILDPESFWEMDRSGRETKITRAQRERQWLKLAARSRARND